MTLYIVIITVIVSALAFYKRPLFEHLSLKPYLVFHRFHLHRLVSHSLVHADWMHLIINMYVLYIFGGVCEKYFALYFGPKSNLIFIELYVFSLIFSSLYSVFKHRNNPMYSAIGASGAVNAVLFTSIFFDPWNKLWFFGVIPVPGIVFGVLYMVYCIIMARKEADNIGHDAHFFGALMGLIFPLFIDFSLLPQFLEKIVNP